MLNLKRISVWDYLAWCVLFGILIWLLLKVFGIINTPVLIEYAPYFGAVYIAGWAMQKLDRAIEDIRYLNRDIKEIKVDLKDIENDVGLIRKNCSVLIKR
ncbi:hypothetical protein J4434_02240 [Candidatus Woesearchaeota archaeon]|nr:hypothetical protein [Candidatus Woesearchaeota archaeon]